MTGKHVRGVRGAGASFQMGALKYGKLRQELLGVRLDLENQRIQPHRCPPQVVVQLRVVEQQRQASRTTVDLREHALQLRRRLLEVGGEGGEVRARCLE